VGINLGAFLASLGYGTLGERVGWSYGFGAAGIGMLIGIAIYASALRTLPPDDVRERNAARGGSKPLGRDEWRAMMALLVLCVPLTFFWAAYEQQGNPLPGG
jgi:POT family proton-dependent oligopeptide transporter